MEVPCECGIEPPVPEAMELVHNKRNVNAKQNENFRLKTIIIIEFCPEKREIFEVVNTSSNSTPENNPIL